MESIFVNGPVNAIRLEGQVYGIHKILYIFMDIHVDLQSQSQCQNFDSEDINKYIIRMLKRTDKSKMFDLFLEITGTQIRSLDYPYRKEYIYEVGRFFKEKISNKLKENEKQKLVNDETKNLRLHYIDIRDFIKSDINLLLQNIQNIVTIFSSGIINIQNYENLIFYTELFRSKIFNIIKIITSLDNFTLSDADLLIKNRSNITVDIDDLPKNRNHHKNGGQYKNYENENIREICNELNKDEEMIKYFFNKIFSRYNHNDLPGKMQELFSLVKKRFSKILNLLDEMLKIIYDARIFIFNKPDILSQKKVSDTIVYSYGNDKIALFNLFCSIQKIIYEVEILSTYNFGMVIDIFFLRRFIDKDYIQNSIIYEGARHSLVSLYFLIKYYDFKITHAAFINDEYKNFNNIEEKIKKSNITDNIDIIFLPQQLNQCVNMTSFPIGFS